LRRSFAPKEGVGCIKLHNEDLHRLYTSQNVITVIKKGE